jgi:hypothetical protein
MSEKPEDGAGQPPHGFGASSQEFQHSQISARVPEKVGKGVFSTGVLVMQTPQEFLLDFVQGMVQPRQLAARVVMAPSFLPNLLSALRDNLAGYQAQYGPPPALRPTVPPAPPAPIEEIYSQLKLPDDMLSGVYANGAMIVHTQGEFCLDFIANFYPRAAVSCRVYMAAAQLPVLVNALTQAYQQYQQKHGQPPGPEQRPG